MLTHFPGVIIEGARQVGKSTLARILAPTASVVNLDDEATLAAAAADPGLFLSGERPLIIDEIQRVPQLTLAIKASIDQNRRPGRFLMTGSSSLLRMRGLADSLVGRVGRLSLYGYSQGEATGHRDDFASAVSQWTHDNDLIDDIATTVTRIDYANVLARGSYPEVISLPDRLRRRWYDSYLTGTVFRDLGEQQSQYDPRRGLATIRVLAGRPASELVYAHLASATGIPASTLTGYVDLWQSAGLITTIAPWTPNLSKREVGKSKVVVIDSGLALHASRMSASQLLAVENLESFGAFLEALVMSELIKQQSWSLVDHDVLHFRDRDGWEVDIILELTDGRVIGIEVKASTSFSAHQFTGLWKLRDRLGSRFMAGFVLNTGQRGYRFADRLYGLPISTIWEL
ncbi:MAG: ATP-binding protein [Propionibacteriaceae bacterium]|nr:ATP-binding protein [Propionibacteriaceae bacterium]